MKSSASELGLSFYPLALRSFLRASTMWGRVEELYFVPNEGSTLLWNITLWVSYTNLFCSVKSAYEPTVMPFLISRFQGPRVWNPFDKKVKTTSFDRFKEK